MKAFAMVVRVVALLAVVGCALGVVAGQAKADLASTNVVSPRSLNLGITPAGQTSAPQTVTFSVVSGSFTLGSVSTSDPQFTPTNTCPLNTPILAGHSCTVTVTFTPTALGPVSAALNFVDPTSVVVASVPLGGGASNAIKLFSSVNVAGSPLPTGQIFNFGSNTVSLSCPASVTALVSNDPNATPSNGDSGNPGQIFEDNYILLTAPAATGTATNICSGGFGDVGDVGGTDCFNANYPGTASNNAAANGTNPDTGTFVADNGVVAPDVSQDIITALNEGTTVQAKFDLIDFGVSYGASTLYLVTSCSQAGVVPGGTIVSNQIDPGNAASLTQTLPFDSTGGQRIAFAINYLNGLNNGNGVTIPPGTFARVADLGINQTDPTTGFPTLVKGTSVAPAICLRHTGEVDPTGVTLCKAYVMECTNAANSIPAGINCARSLLRNLLYEGQFDSPDFPTGSNPIVPGTGPGFLMGSDNWTTAPTPCTFPAGSAEFGQLCPQNPLTEFKGAADPTSGSTPRGVNSTFIPVINVPLPFTLPLILADNIFLWQNTSTVSVKFIGYPAVYVPTAGRPANGFVPAPIQSITFGTTPVGTPVPDPTFPVSTDTTLTNSATCPSVPTPGAPPFKPPTAVFALTEGRYNLHYFATDCANTEELNFKFSANPATNWAQFRTVPVNIDLTAPSITITNVTITPPPKSGKPEQVTVTFNCSDPALLDHTPGSGVVFCGPYLFFAPSNTGSVKATFSKTGHGSFTLNTTDLAGNSQSSMPIPY
jgi:hypothetical protein